MLKRMKNTDASGGAYVGENLMPAGLATQQVMPMFASSGHKMNKRALTNKSTGEQDITDKYADWSNDESNPIMSLLIDVVELLEGPGIKVRT
jgi:hypothetical protein